jgi:hypothetical protein
MRWTVAVMAGLLVPASAHASGWTQTPPIPGTSAQHAAVSAAGVGRLYLDGFYSPDGGHRWLAPVTGVSGTLGIIVPAPSRPLVAYATSDEATAGLWRTTDGGRSWQARGSAPGEILLVDPTNPDRLYAEHQIGSPNDVATISRSDDGGATWTPISGNASVGLAQALPVAQRDGTSALVYVEDAADGSVVLQRSLDGGTTWTAQPTPMSHAGSLFAGGRPGLLYEGLWRGTGLWRSTDAGATWHKLAQPPASLAEDLSEHGFNQFLVDPHAPGHLVVATEQDVWTTSGDARGWHQIATPPLPAASTSLGFDRQGALYLLNGSGAHTLGSAGWRWQGQHGLCCADVEGASQIAVDPGSGAITVTGTAGLERYQHGVWRHVSTAQPRFIAAPAAGVVLANFHGKLSRSLDGGRSFHHVADADTVGMQSLVGSRVVIAGMLLSDDAGRTWHPIGSLPKDTTLIGVMLRTGEPVLIAGNRPTAYVDDLTQYDQLVYESADLGRHWRVSARTGDPGVQVIAGTARGYFGWAQLAAGQPELLVASRGASGFTPLAATAGFYPANLTGYYDQPLTDARHPGLLVDAFEDTVHATTDFGASWHNQTLPQITPACSSGTPGLTPDDRLIASLRGYGNDRCSGIVISPRLVG